VTLNLSDIVYGLLIYIEKLANNGFDLDMLEIICYSLCTRAAGDGTKVSFAVISSHCSSMIIGHVCVLKLDRSSWGLEYLSTTLVPGKLCSSDTDTSIGYDTYRIRGYTIFEKAMTRDTTGIL